MSFCLASMVDSHNNYHNAILLISPAIIRSTRSYWILLSMVKSTLLLQSWESYKIVVSVQIVTKELLSNRIIAAIKTEILNSDEDDKVEVKETTLEMLHDERNDSPLSQQEAGDMEPEGGFARSTHLKYFYCE